MASTTALAGAFMLPKAMLGSALAAPLRPSDAPTTLQRTVLQGSVIRGKYRRLVEGPGEEYIPRPDITGKNPNPDRTRNRRSLAYLGHMSDIHVIDAQSPGRLEPLVAVAASFVDASRPHETLTANVVAEMVSTLRLSAESPLTGAPMAAMLNTGDNADSKASTELDWYIQLLDGGSVVPNSGKADTYEGVQSFPGVNYMWQPGDPDTSDYGPYGYPRLPDLLTAAVSQTVTSAGLPVPWYTTFGNHDALFMGNLTVEPALDALAMGSRKAGSPAAAVQGMFNWWTDNPSMFQQLLNNLRANFQLNSGLHNVTADAERRLFTITEFMQRHLDSPATPGPVGHGFTQDNIDNGTTYWKADLTPYLRCFGLDTCNEVIGADGAVPQDQFDWLEAELQKCQDEGIMAVVASHHNSYTLDNFAQKPIGRGQPLIGAEQFVDMLLKYPNMVAWINGHTHINTITAHPPKEGTTGGFWEITTASCIDFPQQQQLIEFIDNRDGTLSIFTTTIDHNSPAAWSEGDYSQQGLASLSRELASNQWTVNPPVHPGSALDRNCELLLDSPIDLTRISDAALERLHNEQKARILANSTAQEATS